MRTVSNSKRQAILDAAKRSFLAYGYTAANMEAIAQAAHVSKPTLYRHFKGKQDLFAAVIASQCEGLLGTLSQVQTGYQDPVSGLRTIAGAFVDLLYSSDALELYRLIGAEQRNFPNLGELIYRSGPGVIHGQLSSYLTELNGKGVFHIADVSMASQLFLGMLQGHKHFRCLMGLQPGLSQSEKDTLVDAALGLFLRGYGHAG